MALALPLLAMSAGSEVRGWLIIAAHGGLTAGIAAALRPTNGLTGGALPRVALAWLPLVAIPLLYAELPYLIATVGAPFGDAIVQRWEGALFASQPARTLAGAAPWTWLSELLHLAYLSYYGIIYVPLAGLFAAAHRGGRRGAEAMAADAAFSEAALAITLTFTICFVAFVIFPVQGPRFLWPEPEGVPQGPVRALVLQILERGSSRGAAFPSSHMAVAVVQALSAYRWRLPWRTLIGIATVGIGVGAVYGGFHYAIDMVAGAVLGGVVFLAVRRWSTAQPPAAGWGLTR
ncbi:MAG: phosphatase PAP2 family protein [Gemmatimonadaceae bacterium]|nr:phosphatase PAP2 family protein [Gemmatimonadaceae bacterium]